MIIARILEQELRKSAKARPVVAVLGPRQSGKTTLVRNTFPHHTYVDLDDLETRALVMDDPKRFLKDRPSQYGIILDEVQNVPELFSYVKVIADELKKEGFFILTGSQNLALADGISQSLAGRVTELTLMPISISELKSAELLPDNIEEFVLKGGYPEIYGKRIPISTFYKDYANTYIYKDVRKISNVQNLVTFKNFMKACAVRTGQVLSKASIAKDLGIAESTVEKWLSVLVATYTIILLQPFNKKIPKRITKAPKLFFLDTGLACSLVGIRTLEEISNSYLRGNLIETAIIADLYKQYYNNNYNPDDLYFFRTYGGEEIDTILDKAPYPIAIEVKSTKTVKPHFFKGIDHWYDITNYPKGSGYIIYGGDDIQEWSSAKVIGWQFSGDLVREVLKSSHDG